MGSCPHYVTAVQMSRSADQSPFAPAAWPRHLQSVARSLYSAAEDRMPSPLLSTNGITDYVARVAEDFHSRLSPSLVEVYKLGSLAHGGFSKIYSDIDVGLLLNCTEPPAAMPALIAEAKALDADTAKSSQSSGAIRIVIGDVCRSLTGSTCSITACRCCTASGQVSGVRPKTRFIRNRSKASSEAGSPAYPN